MSTLSGQDSTQVLVAPNGKILTAPLGTTQPTDVTTSWAAGWVDLGYADENGVKITPSLTTVNLSAWQSAAPVKTLVTNIGLDLDFNLDQFNADVTSLYFFGATWASLGGGVFKLNMASTPVSQERMMGIEWSDGTVTNRMVIPRGMVSKQTAASLTRKDAMIMGVTFTALDSSGTLAYLLSNSANV